jgi:predicted phage replisome organizer
MSDNKKYYWLKLKDGFFNQKEIKKLRRIAGGDTYTIIYLKMQLLSLKNNGSLFYEGFEDDFCQELALEIDENPENVKVTFLYLQKYGLIEQIKNPNVDEFALPAVRENTGSETSKAEAMRRLRQKRKEENKQIENNENKKVTLLPGVTKCYTEIEIEIEKEKDIEKEIDIYIPILQSWNEKKLLQTHGESAVKRNWKKKHNDIVKDYGVEKIIKAIDNYTNVLNNNKQYYSHKFTLWRFIEKVDDFIDSACPWDNWKSSEFNNDDTNDAYEKWLKKEKEKGVRKC